MKATPYIARTNGGDAVLELRQGKLEDILEADRGGWRNVMEPASEIDGLTQRRLRLAVMLGSHAT